MSAFVNTDASKSDVGCDLIEVVQSYMDDYSSETTYVGSKTCEKGGSARNVPLSSRSTSTTAKVIGAVAAVAFAVVALFAYRRVSKRSVHGEEEYCENDKLGDESFDTHSFGEHSTQEGSMLKGGGGSIVAVRMLNPINENVGDTSFRSCAPAPFDECKGDIEESIKSLSRPSSPVAEEPTKDASGEKDRAKLCCNSECVAEMTENIAAATDCCGTARVMDDTKENIAAATDCCGTACVMNDMKENIAAATDCCGTARVVDDTKENIAAATDCCGTARVVDDTKENIAAATACCGAACVSNDMNENFTAVKDHVSEAVTSMEDNTKEDIVAVEENVIQNIADFEEGMDEDIAGVVAAVAAAVSPSADTSTTAGGGAGGAAAAPDSDDADDKDAKAESIDDYANELPSGEYNSHNGHYDEVSPRSGERTKDEDKAALQEKAIERIDDALKNANWVGVLSTANEVAQVAETEADTTDAESVATPYHLKPYCLSRCCIDSDDLGAISDKIVVVGSNLTHEDEVMGVEAFDNSHGVATR